MPRIDPERLLKTLAPLLEPTSGAIKSSNEVDKIYGLMSKFSKKLVSKCTYINILTATPAEVLDLFLQRGGWDMVLGWTIDAAEKKNYELLREISGLLLYAPATVQRLKENELPKVVKSLSKDCENAEIRELAKKVVMKWITIAKNQELPSVPILSHNNVSSNAAANTHSTVPVQSSSVTSSKAPGDSDNHAGELDISSFDINAMIDFNPDDFSKAVDQLQLGDLSEAVASGNAVVHSIDNASIIMNDSEAIKIELGSNHQLLPKTPKLLIKTVDGQAAVHDLGSKADSTKKDDNTPFCIMMRDGKPFLVRLKLASVQEVKVADLQNASSLQEITSTSSETSERRKPRKDPSITSMRTTNVEEKHQPSILKTYSKKSPVETIPMASSESSSSTSKKSSNSSKSSKLEKDSTSSKKHRSGSKSTKAAAAAKKIEDEKLRDKIKQEKQMLKKRAKEAAKQKQVDKDQETLKKLNLNKEPSVTTPPNSKIPKIPKRQPSSFADAIGIPGSSDAEKTIKKRVSMEEREKDSSENGTSPTKSVNKTDGLPAESKERKHRVKVYQSHKSRADDLLKDMTETAKSNKPNKSDNKSSESILMGDKSLAGNSLIFKPEKRPSIDGMEKPGDSKKPKIEESDKKKESKNSSKDKKAVNVIKESSLFMDALTATTDSQKKRKRRLSSANEKDIVISKPGKSTASPTSETPPPDAVKPNFNFYRETLDGDKDECTTVVEENPSSPSKDADEPMDVSEEQEAPNSSSDDEVLFIPTEEELALKSVLVLHRSKNKPKKSVRFRDDEELTELFIFELDEQERINVTKHKDFMAMKDSETAEEKRFMARGVKHSLPINEDVEERMPWRRPPILSLNVDQPVIDSKEKSIQEERERLNLGVFLPPGSVLPDTPSEPELASPSEEERAETRVIPMEDVMNVTKVFDNRNMKWPRPHISSMQRVHAPIISPNQPPINYGSRFSDIQQPVQNAGNLGLLHQNQNTQPQPSHLDFNNPWNMGAVNHPNNNTAVDVNKINEMVGFSAMNLPSGPIAFPPPNIASNPFGFPIQTMPPMQTGFSSNINFAAVQAQMAAVNSLGREAINRGQDYNSSMRGGSGAGRVRDFGDQDLRRQINESRDRNSKRDGYESRGGRPRNDHRARDHDRDRRSPSPPRRRRDERDRLDKDYRDHDYRSKPRSGGKKDVPCRFFSKGHCNNGSRCEFSHEVGNQDKTTRHDSSSRSNSARRSSPSPTESWEDSGSNNLFERRSSSETSRDFADTPSSPTNVVEDPSGLPAKIIPVE